MKVLSPTEEFERGAFASNFGMLSIVKLCSENSMFICAALHNCCCRTLLCGMVTYVMEMNHCETRRPVLPDGMVCERSVRTRARCAYRVPLRTWVVAVTGGGRLAAIEKILVFRYYGPTK